jgi:hypothetical protein
LLTQIPAVRAAAAGLRWVIGLAPQHLFIHPFACAACRPGPVDSPAEQAFGEWEAKVRLENKNA